MRLIALEYHDVVADGAWDSSGFRGRAAATYKLSADRFRQHLDALQRASTAIVNDVGLTRIDATSSSSRVLLTFDDGGSGYLNYAADELESRGWRGHVFMTTGFIGQPGFLTSAELRDLDRRGHVIGSHSRTHPMPLSSLPPGNIAQEWAASLGDLQDILGKAVHVASVPGGFHSTLVAELAAASGIRTLFTSEPVSRGTTVSECRILGRYTLRRGDDGAYVARLVGSPPFARANQWCRWNAKKVLKNVAGGYYQRVRERILGS
ncbi:MAG TPA: polysaccharide deacetylase family protein [Gemmatimonadaceae bacterium]